MADFQLATVLSLFLSITFTKLSDESDALFPDQTIAVGQTLISRNQIFELGFFSPGKSRNIFLGIWYKSTPDTVVWVANRNNRLSHSKGANFAISRNGTLAITISRRIIWSSNSSTRAESSNPVLQILDTGNLVLVENTAQGSRERYIWQSFDYPTDTWLPGMRMVGDDAEKYLTSWRNSDDPSPGDYVYKIVNQGLAEKAIFRGKTKTFRTGRWNGLYWSGTPPFPNPVFKPEFVFEAERLIYNLVLYESSAISRFTMETSGLLQRYFMNARRDRWNLVYTLPRDTCDEYGLCGPFGICSIERTLRICECLRGFSPKSKKDWELQDWSGGCKRNSPLDCNGDGFVEVRGVKYPDMLMFSLNMSMSLGECRAECLKNCSCTAYANPYIINGGSGCVMWFGDLVDTREVPGADSKQNIYVRSPVSELDFSSNLEDAEKKSAMMPILVSVCSGVLVSGFINGCLHLLTRRKRQAGKMKHEDIELPLFKMEAVVAATNNFSEKNMIGEGGFGPVYRGRLSSKEEIAVKRLSRTSGQGLEEFKNEVILIAKLQHTNLVGLLGCCVEGEERILIYEYLHNKSLDYFVFDQYKKTLLTWPKRFDIIMGIARGLHYLHHDSRLKVIHRDLKTSNILLDENFNPKISDFGLARTFGEDQPVSRTRRVVGTYGYMAPEYAIAGKFSVKSDVFSMGVLLLEIVSGKKNRGLEQFGDQYHSLLGHAWLLWKENKGLEMMDECLIDTFLESQVKRCIHVGLLCVQKFAEDRPVMSSVLFMLGTDAEVLPEPKEPGFFVEGSELVSNCKSSIVKSERNTMTITDLEAR